MKKNIKHFVAAGLILLALQACITLPPQAPPEDPGAMGDAVATAVAQTLEAGGVPGEGPPADVPGGGDPPGGPPDDVPPGDPPGDPPADPPGGPPAVLRIAYLDDGDVWLWTEGAGAAEIYDGAFGANDVRISDDGMVVAFQLFDGYTFVGLWAVNSDGTNARSLVDAATVTSMGTNPGAVGTEPYSWEFIPGSHTVAFNTRQFYEGPGLDIQEDLHLVDADSAVLTTLLAAETAGEFYYSPDGSQIALVTPTTISLINADGSNRRDDVLVYNSLITYSEYQWYAKPRWAADGNSLRVAIPTADILDPAATVAVFDIPTDGSPATSMGFTAAEPLAFMHQNVVSPDLQKLAFLRRAGVPTDNIWEIHFADLSTFALSYFHTGGVRFEVWSPDSVRFVFEEGGHLYVGQMGVTPVMLPDTDRGTDPTWVDVDRVLYLSGSIGNWELRLQTVGGALTVIALTTGDFVPYDFAY